MASNEPKTYSLVRYWRYVFVPLVIIVIFIGWWTIFSMSRTQLTIGSLPTVASAPAMAMANAAASAAKI